MHFSGKTWATLGYSISLVLLTLCYPVFWYGVGTHPPGLFACAISICTLLYIVGLIALDLPTTRATFGILFIATAISWFVAPLQWFSTWFANLVLLYAIFKPFLNGVNTPLGTVQTLHVFLNLFWFIIFALGVALLKSTPWAKLIAAINPSVDPYRSDSTVFGDARLGSWQAVKSEIAPKNPEMGIVIGEDYSPRRKGSIRYNSKDKTTWGQGGKAPLILMDMAYEGGHSVVISGSGGGKTAANVIPTCMYCRAALVVIDPDSEALMASRDIRTNRMGRDVREISFEPGCSIDLLKIIEPYFQQDQMAFREIAKAMLMIESKNDFSTYYFGHGVEVIAALMEHFYTELKIHPFDGLADILKLTTADVKKEYTKIALASKIPNIIAVMNQMATQGEDFFQWLQPTMKKSLNWMVFPDIRRSLMAEPTNAADPLAETTDIFITISGDRLSDMGGYVKLILGVIVYHLKNRAVKDHRRLLIVDEAAKLGYVPLFEEIRDATRKVGCHIMLIFQSITQINDCYGVDGDKKWANVALRAYSAIEDIHEAEIISKIIGNYTADVQGKSSGQNQSPFSVTAKSLNSSTQYSLQRASLINPDEVRTLPTDAQILIFRRQRPIICGKALAFRRKEWAGYKSLHESGPP